MPKILEHVLAHVPRCLSGVRASPVNPFEDRGCESIAFRLGSKNGESKAQILGYDLKAYNPDYEGHEFISPLSLLWLNSTAPVLIFDSEIHGYHGEMQSSAKYHGKGGPVVFSCPKCKATHFVVNVQFDYWEACNDLWNDDPEIAIENYYCNIMVNGECSCGQVTRIVDMDL